MSSFNTAGPNGVSNICGCSTIELGNNAALKLYDYLRLHIMDKHNKFSYSDCAEFEDDLLYAKVTKIRTLVTHDLVPRRFKVEDGLLLPQNSQSTDILGADRLVQYIGKILAQIRTRYSSSLGL